MHSFIYSLPPSFLSSFHPSILSFVRSFVLYLRPSFVPPFFLSSFLYSFLISSLLPSCLASFLQFSFLPFCLPHSIILLVCLQPECLFQSFICLSACLFARMSSNACLLSLCVLLSCLPARSSVRLLCCPMCPSAISILGPTSEKMPVFGHLHIHIFPACSCFYLSFCPSSCLRV